MPVWGRDADVQTIIELLLEIWDWNIGHKQSPAKTQYRNAKQIFPEKELRGLSPIFHSYVSVNDLYIPPIGLPILLQENMWTDPRNM